MQTFKRILAIIVMVISVLMLALSLVGIVGVWIARAQLSADLVAITATAEGWAADVQQNLDQIDTVLTQAGDLVAAVEQDAQGLGADLEQNKPLLTAISQTVGVELEPLVDSLLEIMAAVRETVAAVNSAVEAINAIPFISAPKAEQEALKKLSQDLDDLDAEVRNLLTALEQKRTEIIQGAVSLITTPTSQIGGTLGEMQTIVADYSQQLGAVQEGLAYFKAVIVKCLTWAALILTLLLLWFAFSQLGLLLLGWRVVSGQDLLAHKQPEPPTDVTLPQAGKRSD